MAFILFRTSRLLLGKGKGQEEEGTRPDEVLSLVLLAFPTPVLKTLR